MWGQVLLGLGVHAQRGQHNSVHTGKSQQQGNDVGVGQEVVVHSLGAHGEVVNRQGGNIVLGVGVVVQHVPLIIVIVYSCSRVLMHPIKDCLFFQSRIVCSWPHPHRPQKLSTNSNSLLNWFSTSPCLFILPLFVLSLKIFSLSHIFAHLNKRS